MDSSRALAFGDSRVNAAHIRHVFQRIHPNRAAALPDHCAIEPHKVQIIGVEQPQVATKRKLPTKRVRFDEQANQQYDDTILNLEEHSPELWYTLPDLRSFKKEASRFVKDVIKIEKGQAAALSFRQVFLEAYDACCHSSRNTAVTEVALTDSQRHNVNMWMAIASDRWGLERPCVKEIHYDKSSRKKAIARVVLEVQSMTQHVDEEVRADYLRKAALNISRPSALFGRLIGQAQETVMAQ